MSMIGNLMQISPEMLAGFIAKPDEIESFLYPEDDEHENGIDIDKAWHGVHFLLSGDAWGGEAPLADAILGGTEIGDDAGYGPAKYLTTEEVRAVAAALRELSASALGAKYDASDLTRNEIYPAIWDEPDSLNYLLAAYESVRSYYEEAAAKGNAMLKFLN